MKKVFVVLLFVFTFAAVIFTVEIGKDIHKNALSPKMKFYSNGDGTCCFAGVINPKEGTHLVIPETSPEGETVVAIGSKSGCFGIEGIKSVIIPDTVKVIERSAFAYCKNLTSVIIPNSVEWIYYGAFKGCDKLELVTIGRNVEYIGEMVFYGSNSLSNVTFVNPDGWRTRGSDLAAEELLDSEIAAKYLKDTYKHSYWVRE